MIGTIPWRSQARANDDHAVVDDFQELFEIDMSALYRLAFLMIADGRKAEECLIAALDDCISGTPVSKKWARSWAHRAVVRNAIRISTEPEEGRSILISHSETASIDGDSQEIPADVFAEFAPILSLNAFERIVFVLCILEQYRILDCALLLGRSQRDVLEARSRAAELVAVCNLYPPRNTIVHKTSVGFFLGESEERGETDDSHVTLLI
jgi:DNA-directed RNA polymerase specialized sigma24 family protein